MVKLVWEFLNTRYRNVFVYHQLFYYGYASNLPSVTENFITDKGDVIISLLRIHYDKETRVDFFLKEDIKRYFDIHDFEIEIYVLEWCRNKNTNVVEIRL